MPKVLSPRNDDNEFNVRSYFAKGDGTTDDSAAFQAAADAAVTYAASNGGAKLLIPPGNYKLNSTFKVVGGKVTIEAYGAYIFAGSNNDLFRDWTSQDSSFTLNGFGLQVLGGIWDLKGQNWGISSNASLNASGFSAFTISNSSQVTFRDVTIRNVYDYHGIDINTCEKVLIDGCRFEGFQNNFKWISTAVKVASTGNLALSGLVAVDGYTVIAGDRVLAKNQTTGTQNGIYVAAAGAWSRATDFAIGLNVDRTAVSINTTANGGQGTQQGTAWYISTVNAVVNTNATTWVQTTGFNTQSRYFSEAVQIDNGPNAIACKNITVNNCYMGPATDGSGLLSFGKMAGTHTDSSGQFYTNMKFTNNTSVGSLSNAFQGYSFADSIIANNTILGSSERGIRMFFNSGNSGPRLNITNNVISQTVLHGIEIDGSSPSQLFSDVNISGNTITSTAMTGGSSSTGIHVDTCNQLIVANNTINLTSSTSRNQGIFCETITGGTISGNHVTSAGTQAIQIASSTLVKCSGNTVVNPLDGGIYISASSTSITVSDNYIIGANQSTTSENGAICVSTSANTDIVVKENRVRKGTGTSTQPFKVDSSTSAAVEFNNNSLASDWTQNSYANYSINSANTLCKLIGSDGTHVVALGADTGNLTQITTYAIVTGLTCAVPVPGKYRIKAFLNYTQATAVVGNRFSLGGASNNVAGPTATLLSYSCNYETGVVGTSVNQSFAAYLNASSTAVSPGAIGTPYSLIIDGYAVITAAGTFSVQYMSGSASDAIVVKNGSTLIVEKIA